MIDAVVQAGGWETRYVRAGRGPQVLILTMAGDGGWAHGLLSALASRFRVYLPERPGLGSDIDIRSEDAAVWLRGVIDGLGLDRPVVVADAELQPMLESFTTTDAELVGRVTLIGAPTDDVELRSLVAALDPDALVSGHLGETDTVVERDGLRLG